MKTYKVIKEFPSSDGGYIHKKDSKYKPTKSAMRTKNLLRLGYIMEIPEQPKTVWDLKEGDICYYLTAMGTIQETTFNNLAARDCLTVGSLFLTIEEAKKELARRKAKQILLRDTKGFKPNWKNLKQAKWYVSYFCNDETLEIDTFGGSDAFCEIYFANEQDAKSSIKAHEKEWKTYLGVKDEDL